MMRSVMTMTVVFMLSACGEGPTSGMGSKKTASYDPKTQSLTLPQSCPDWSSLKQSSNFGCSVNTNSALQLADPKDLNRGHGDVGPDAEITTKVIESYRRGDIPVPLTPEQSISGAPQ